METREAFLEKIKEKIVKGVYKEHFELPFMSEDKLYDAIESRVKQREENGSTPIVTDVEIMEMIKEMKEASGFAFHLFLKNGFLEKTEKGYSLTKKGKLAISTALKN